MHRLEIVLPSIASEDQTSFIKNQYLSSVWYIIFSSHGDSRLYLLPGYKEGVWLCGVRVSILKLGKIQVWTQNLFLDKIALNPQSFQTPSSHSCLTSKPSKGVPSSPLLFDVDIEPLATLRGWADVSGKWRRGVMHKVSLYVEDHLVFLSCESIHPIFYIFTPYVCRMQSELNTP